MKRNPWTDPEAPDIGSKAFLALLCVAVVVGWAIIVLAIWVRG